MNNGTILEGSCMTTGISEPIFPKPQQVLPLAKFLKAYAFGDLEGRDDAAVYPLARLPGGFARSTIFPAGLIEVSDKPVPLDCRPRL
jgi:hypothetical protein